jgi:hypothetical protein
MSWIAGLRFEDLQRLREAVWRVHFQHMPGTPFDKREADKLIEALGPEVGETMIKKIVDGRSL